MSDSQIFKTAVKLPPEERQAYLDEACGNNPELRQEVESLLRASDADDSFLEKPAADPNVLSPTVDVQPITEAAGSLIGPYKLLQQIGEGGMGVVYLAEQQEPVRRKVALKIIKPGMDSRQVVARFEAERQALAMMEHQNIARVLDAGTTETGRPYFVMELVKGVPITEYCDRNQLTPRERLDLFVPVCHAVQHAHQKGIIHRDLKPSNVLVCLYDGQPTPKVIDFGVAKATEQRLTEKTLFTQHGQIIGTLEYMSPEQAEMSQLDIDTRSDIYSLGVLLYELLTGSTPITKEQFREAGFAEMLQLIREQEPVRPSTRLSESGDALPAISAQRSTEPKKLSLLLRGELDWIVLKALEKDRTRRYETANGFARDIQRHLEDEPVEACPPSAGYRLRKFARKHRAALATTAAFAALLIVGVVVSTWQAVRATDAEAQARSNEEQALENEAKARAAAEAEKQAKDAEAAQRKLAETERKRAVELFETALDQLSHSLFQNARRLLASNDPGRRWATLEMLRGAEGLRIRQGVKNMEELLEPKSKQGIEESLGAALALGHWSDLAGGKPSRGELRTQAVDALLLDDAHVVREWSGMAHSVSPDGRFAASVVIDLEQDTGAVVITDLASGKEVSKWEGADAEKIAGLAIALGPQAKRLASITMDMRQVNVWELPERTLLRKLSLPKSAANAPSSPPTNENGLRALIPFEMLRSVSFSPNGRFVAAVASGPRGRVVVWDLQNESDGRVAGRLEQFLGNISFSHDSRLLAFASARKKVTLWNLAEQRVDKELELPLALAGSHGFTPEGQLAIRCYGSLEKQGNQAAVAKIMLVWDVDADKEARRIALDTNVPFGRISISPDGARAAVADLNGQIVVYGISKDVILVKLDHGAQVQLLEWSHEGRHLLSGGIGALRMWEFADDVPLRRLSLKFDSQQGKIGLFALSPDGRYLAVARLGFADIVLFDRTSGKKIRKLTYKETAPSSPQRLAFSPDSRQLVRLGVKGLIGWNVDTGEQRIRIRSHPPKGDAFFSVGVRADGRIVTGGLRDYKPVALIAGEDRPIWSGNSRAGLVVVSPDGRLVTAFNSRLVPPKIPSAVYDLSTGEQKFQLSGSMEKATQPIGDFSPDSHWLLVVETKGSMAAGISAVAHSFGGAGLGNLAMGMQQHWSGGIWNVETGEKHLEVAGASYPTAYAFSPDGRYLAVTMRNGSIRLWNVDAKTELFEWKPTVQGPRAIGHIAFTADSTSLVVPDGISPVLQMLDLTRLEKGLAEYGLGW